MRESVTATSEGGEQVERTRSRGTRSLLAAVRDWLGSLLVALLLFFGVRAWVVEAFKIPTASMEGTLLVGDFLLVNKAIYGVTIPLLDVHVPGFVEPDRGHIVVFHPPHEPDRNYVKRIVGIPGDTLEMRDKRLVRNGVVLDESYVTYIDPRGDAVHPDMRWQSNHLIANPPRRYEPTRDNWGPIVVPRDRYFVLGDNRDNSEDSRYWGFVDRQQIRGRPWRVYYSYAPEPGASLAWVERVRWGRLGAPIL